MAGIYIHIPFCKKNCHYCDFYKTLDTGLSDSYIEALRCEILQKKEYLPTDSIIETIYLGGGTPSVLDINRIRTIIEALHEHYTISQEAEITMELNPDDVSKAYIRGLAREGINRLSLGIQSWDDSVLKMLNRRHNSQQALRAVEIAQEEGFDNISVDLIYGIPGISEEQWKEALKKTFCLKVQHISAYHLTIEKNTMFGKMKELGELIEIDEELSEKQFNILSEMSREEGYIHYEISNLCMEAYYSKHNTNYWKQENYIGLGPSAHSYNGYSRQWNISSLSGYIDKMNKGEEAFEKEVLEEKEKFNEYIMTSLRTIWGVDMAYLETTFSKETHDYLLNLASRFIKYGMIEKTEKNNLVLTNQGKMISDNIISELIMA